MQLLKFGLRAAHRQFALHGSGGGLGTSCPSAALLPHLRRCLLGSHPHGRYAGIHLVSSHPVSGLWDDIFHDDLYHDIIADQQHISAGLIAILNGII